MVAAASCGAKRGRMVWIDLFAVRQFPGNEADLDFRGVVRPPPARPRAQRRAPAELRPGARLEDVRSRGWCREVLPRL